MCGTLNRRLTSVLIVLFLYPLSFSVTTSRTLLQDTENGECDITNTSVCGITRICAPVSNDDAICAIPPIGGAVISLDETTLPTPYAYFPLSSDEVQSWPVDNFNGTVSGAVLVSDADFGAVYRCQRGSDLADEILLEDVAVTQDGSFAINLWIKLPLSCGQAARDQYILSTTGGNRRRRFDEDLPNQIQLLLTSSGPGDLTAIVRDDDDDESEVEVDSGSEISIHDGAWHMITISTFPSSARELDPVGIRLFVDGIVVGETEETGGESMDLDGEIHLCKRFDDDEDSRFDGFITQLSFYSSALSEEQVDLLFSTIKDSVLNRSVRSRRQDRDVRFVRGREVDSGLAGHLEDDQVTFEDTPSGFNFTEFSETTVLCETADPDPDCGRREICAPIHECLLTTFDQGVSESDGVCVRDPRGDFNIFAEMDSGIEIPMGYFPLRGGVLESWPIGQYRGYTMEIEIEEDDEFGEVFVCSKEDRSLIVLENVPYGKNRNFAINFWFKSTNLEGTAFQYLFSHGSVDPPSGNPWSRNQVQVLLPEEDHIGYGVLRVVVKDSNDTETAVFLDSDGEVSSNAPKDPTSIEDQPVQPTDGEWHMVTITTLDEMDRGFLLYLDGQEVARFEEDDEEIPPGGDELRPGGKIYLCGRNDAASNRYFDGRLAELALFDRSLTRRQISNLYRSV